MRVIVAFLIVLLVGVEAQAAVTFRAATSQAGSTANPATHAVTVDSTDHVLIVPLVILSATLRAGGDPTIGGQAMTQAGTTHQAAASPESSVEIWYILNPPQGSQTISVPNSGTLNVRFTAIGGTSSTGVAVFDSADGGENTSTNPADTITTGADGCLIVGVVGNGATTWAPTAQTGTSVYDVDFGNLGGSVQYFNQTNAGAQSVGWTFGSASEDWNIASAAFTTGAASSVLVRGPLLGVGP